MQCGGGSQLFCIYAFLHASLNCTQSQRPGGVLFHREKDKQGHVENDASRPYIAGWSIVRLTQIDYGLFHVFSFLVRELLLPMLCATL